MARIENNIVDKLEVIDLTLLNQSNTLLVTIDMVKGFINEGNLADHKIGDIIPSIVEIKKQLHLAHHLCFIDYHKMGCQEFQNFVPHCIQGTTECEMVDELKDCTHYIYKNSNNGFLAPDFLDHLEKWVTYDHFIITGCCTDICVLQFVLSLKGYLNQHDLDKDVIVIIDAVDTYHDPLHHDAYEYNKIAYQLMKQNGIKIVKM